MDRSKTVYINTAKQNPSFKNAYDSAHPDLTDEKVVPIMLEKFAYGKYILCSDENVAEFISELKRDLASEGIKFGDIFTYHTETPQEIAIKGFLDY